LRSAWKMFFSTTPGHNDGHTHVDASDLQLGGEDF
jgi:hypothetical protein